MTVTAQASGGDCPYCNPKCPCCRQPVPKPLAAPYAPIYPLPQPWPWVDPYPWYRPYWGIYPTTTTFTSGTGVST